LFLKLFNNWVKTDSVAKRFLTELNGFDFLLDRLFSKSEDSEDYLSPTVPSLIDEFGIS
jgi:hypothetical protein